MNSWAGFQARSRNEKSWSRRDNGFRQSNCLYECTAGLRLKPAFFKFGLFDPPLSYTIRHSRTPKLHSGPKTAIVNGNHWVFVCRADADINACLLPAVVRTLHPEVSQSNVIPKTLVHIGTILSCNLFQALRLKLSFQAAVIFIKLRSAVR